jgi:uncharacterized OsmC-like protein
MDREALRAAQAVARERYRQDPAAAMTPLVASAAFLEPGITCTVDTSAGPARAGLHPATGGTGADACSGDMLLQALLACAGVTLRSVATAMGLELGAARLTARSTFDARGTLGMDRTIDVGVGPITIDVEVPVDLDVRTAARLAKSTERYCVVGQSLRQPVTIEVHAAIPG